MTSDCDLRVFLSIASLSFCLFSRLFFFSSRHYAHLCLLHAMTQRPTCSFRRVKRKGELPFSCPLSRLSSLASFPSCVRAIQKPHLPWHLRVFLELLAKGAICMQEPLELCVRQLSIAVFISGEKDLSRTRCSLCSRSSSSSSLWRRPRAHHSSGRESDAKRRRDQKGK